MTAVQHVPLLSKEAVTHFFSKEKDDCVREPLLAIGWLCLFTHQIQSFCGYRWNHVVNLGLLGSSISELTDYWDFVDFAQSGRRACLELRKISRHILFGTETSDQLKRAAKNALLFSFKAISNGVNFIGLLQQTRALSSFYVHEMKLVGSALGGLYYANLLYEGLQNRPELSLEIQQGDSPEVRSAKETYQSLKSEEAKNIYLAQHKRKTQFETVALISILSIKIFSFCAAFYSLFGGPNPIRLIASRKEGLLFGSFTFFTVSALGSYFSGEQMKAFAKLNQSTETGRRD